MRILFVTFSDISVCSSSNIRNVSLIKGLLDHGHQVDIISYKTANKVQVHDETFKTVTDRCKIIELIGVLATEKISAGLLSSGNTSLKAKIYNRLRKIYYSLEPVDSLRTIALSLDIEKLGLEEYDLMISSSNPYSVHILADRIRKRYFASGIKWVQYWGDALYYDTLNRNPILPSRLKKAEHNLIKDSDLVVYTNGVVLEKQKKLYKDMANKMTFIETPYAFAKESTTEEFKYQVGYFGSFSTVVRDITPLYSVLSEANYNSIIIGNGDVEIIPTETLKAMPRATVSVVSEYEENTRILVCICNKLTAKGDETGAIPGKAYHYAATDKTVLMIGASPEVEAFLKKYHRFVFVPNDPQQIKDTISDILEKPVVKEQPLTEVDPICAAKRLIETVNSL